MQAGKNGGVGVGMGLGRKVREQWGMEKEGWGDREEQERGGKGRHSHRPPG